MIDADDLALLAKSFDAAMQQAADRAAADVALHELGWAELLDAAPHEGAATAFTLLGSTGSAATLLDDVLLAALDLAVEADTCVVVPAPHVAVPPARTDGGQIVVDGLVSARVDTARRVVVPVAVEGGVVLHDVVADVAGVGGGATLDPARPYRRLRASLDGAVVGDHVDWPAAVRDARLALAHQLIGASRRMLDLARAHAVDRAQFGRPVASFQAVRHKLADAFVAIEAAAAVAGAALEDGDDLVAAVAKSLAGKAARVTAAHAQQVLAGIGFTTEHPFHLLLKRTMVLDTLFGSARSLPVEIGRTLVAQRTAPRLVDL